MRDVGGFVDTRYRLLQLRSNNRNNWISFAIAHHLDGNHELCVQILSAYESTLVSNSQKQLQHNLGLPLPGLIEHVRKLCRACEI
jgi:hypothetical protein